MGGLNTEVGDATVNVLIESAQFDPLSIRRTSRKLALMSESNYRFERGVDAAGADAASLKACRMILELAGGQLAEGILDVWDTPHVPATVELRPQRTQAILGMEIPRARQVELLARLNLSPREQDGKIVCTIPSYRRDLSREIDLIEEIARLHGYDKIPVSSQVRHSVTPPGRIETLRRQVGSVLTACGFDEAITFTFVDAAEAALFGCEKPVQVDPLVRKSNNALRPTVLPSLMRCCKTNQDAGNGGANLFELSAVFRPGASGLPEEHTELAMAGTRDLRELRGTMEELAATVAPKAKITFVPAGVPGLASDAAAEILLDGKACGSVGMIAKNVLDHYGLEHEIAAGTIRFDALLALAGAARKYEPLPRFPSVRRDVSLIVDEGLTWRQLSECIEGVEQELRAGYEYVTTYRGKPIESGKKSVTITLVYRSASGTLRSEQVDEQVSQVIAAAKEKFAADVRI
jgi:phenylalanyl-tRNA synthetase beta chain